MSPMNSREKCDNVSEPAGGACEVDMMAIAREAQWSAERFLGHGAVKAVAPAKVNLILAVGARREDGYHEARTIMHALALHDTLYVVSEEATAEEAAQAAARNRDDQVVVGPDDNIVLTIDVSDRAGAEPLAVAARDNIVCRAVDELARMTKKDAPCKVGVRIEKLIPHEAGLGGGSSDAAAVLVALAEHWGLAADDPRLEAVAQGIGADVAFFLRGGCALYGGVGSTFERSLTPAKEAVLLVKPAEGVSTAEAYRRFDEAPVAVNEEAVRALAEAQAAADVPLFNNLTAAAESILPELEKIRAWLDEEPAVTRVLLSGSGSATFALADDFSAALRLAAEAGARGWWARATTLSGLRAAIVPRRRGF